jgi:two-component system chemotaxis response regulator CheB
MPEEKLGVLIADDSALMRRLLRKIIEADDTLYVMETARDGVDAIEKAERLRPAVVSMDINMPRMDGLTALERIIEANICPVVMLSSLTQKGASTTFEAMELGAFDYVAKPDGTVTSNMEDVARELVTKLKKAAKSNFLRTLNRRRSHRVPTRSTSRVESPRTPARAEPTRLASPPSTRPARAARSSKRAVVIGISTGGPKTLMEVLPYLPPNLNAPMFLVQHMPPSFTASFAERLNRACSFPVYESESGMEVEPGACYLAKGGFHLNLLRKTDGQIVIRNASRPQHQFMPSVDVMFDSVFSVYGSGTVGVLMTGMGNDGAKAMAKIRQGGGKTIAESEESAVVFGMPQEAIKMGGADVVVPCWQIAQEITKLI